MVSPSRLLVAAVIAAVAVIDRHIGVSLGVAMGVNAQFGQMWAARQFGRAPRDLPAVHYGPLNHHPPQLQEPKDKATAKKPETPKWTYTPPPTPVLEMPTELLDAIAAESSSTETDAVSEATCLWVDRDEI